jgi:hypothetical protein
MAKFLFVYHGEPFDISKASPEMMQKTMSDWTKWIQQGFAEGWLLDPGDALGPAGRVVKNQEVTDGPFIETKELVGGYSVIEAPTIDHAVIFAKSCPASTDGGFVEIRPMAGLSAPPA